MDSPRFSIVTPSFNQGRFLERAIRSVLDQDYKDFEYIIIDGGSTDGSVEIIRRYESRLAFWTSEKDRGQADAINKGFLKSRGSLLAWLNSDDALAPGALRAVAGAFERYPDTDVMHGHAHVIDADDHRIGTNKTYRFLPRAMAYEAQSLPQSSVFWRRELFFEVGLLNPELHYLLDPDLWLRFAARGARFRRINAPLSSLRVHSFERKCAGTYSRVPVSRWQVEWRRVTSRYQKHEPGSPAYRLHRGWYRILGAGLLILQGDLGYVFTGLRRLSSNIFRSNRA